MKDRHAEHKVYLLVELRISGELEDQEATGDRYVARAATFDDVLELSSDFTRDLDADIEDSIERSSYTWDDIKVRASAIGILKAMPRNRVY